MLKHSVKPWQFMGVCFIIPAKITSTAMEGPAVSVVALPYFTKILLTLSSFPYIH